MAEKRRPAATKKAARATKKTAKRATGSAAAKASPRRAALTLTTISPSLTVNDLEASLDWYGNVLGFKIGERWEHDGKLVGAELAAGKISLMLAQDDWKKGRDRDKGQGVRLYCITGQDIDGLAARIKAQGGKLLQEPKDQPWGVRDLALDDPDGFKLTIAAPLKKRKKK